MSPQTKALIHIFVIVSLFWINSCNKVCVKQPQNQKQIDSLIVICDSLVNDLEFERLRALSLQLIDIQKNTGGGSCAGEHEAYSYLFTSYFNEKEYKKCISMIDDYISSHNMSEYPIHRATFLYTRSRCYQYLKDFSHAELSYQEMFTVSTDNPKEYANMAIKLQYALQQYMNCFLLSGEVKKGIEQFTALENSPNRFFADSCSRARLIFLAYMHSFAQNYDVALQIIARAQCHPQMASADMEYADLVYTNEVYRYVPGTYAKRIELLNRAIKIGRERGTMRTIQWAMSLLGNVYTNNNDLYNALTLILESIEICKTTNDNYSLAYCYKILSDFYIRCEMWTRAEQTCILAYQTAQKSPSTQLLPYIAFNQYYISTSTDKKSQKELLEKWKMASKEANLEDLQFISDMHAMSYKIENKDSSGYYAAQIDSLYEHSNSSWRVPAMTLGKYYIKQGGDPAKGERYLQKVIKMKDGSEFSNSSLSAYNLLINRYVESKNSDKLFEIIPAYVTLRDTITKLNRAHQTFSAMVEYETMQKEQQNRLLSSQLEIKNRRLQIFIISLAAIMLLTIAMIVIIYNRQKIVKLQRRLIKQQTEQLQSTISHMKELHNDKEQLTIQLAQYNDKESPVDSLLDNIHNMVTQEHVATFKRLFNDTYPKFTFNLRSKYRDITRGEELLAMFIHLNQTNDEIASALGISDEGVKKSRYRLRKKLMLDKSDSLEEKIHENA